MTPSRTLHPEVKLVTPGRWETEAAETHHTCIEKAITAVAFIV